MIGIGDPAPRRRTRRANQEAPPVHRHGRQRARSVPSDRRTLAVRVPFVALLAIALVGAVTSDDPREDEQLEVDRFRPAAVMPAAPPPGPGSSTWYCAAGTTEEGGMADHTVVMVNPGTDDLEATLTAFAGDMAGAGSDDGRERPPVTQALDLPAGEQVSVRLAEVIESPLAAALVEVAGGPVSVEHRVSGEHGADAAPCSTTAAPRWHLAWGATTRDAREVVVIFNPFPSAATVDGVFTTEDGAREPVRLQGLPIPARGVVGIEVGEDVTRSEQVSATFTVRSGHVVVDRLQQHDGSLGIESLSLAPAVPAASATWVFADGEATAPAPPVPEAAGDDAEVADDEEADDEEADDEEADDEDGDADDAAEDAGAGRSERIVVYNPDDERADVEVHVVPGGGDGVRAPPPFRLSIGARGVEVVDLGEHERVEPGVPHSIVVDASDGRPVVAERVTVDSAAPGEASDSDDDRPGVVTATPGSPLAAERWTIASIAPSEIGADQIALVVFNPDPDRTVEVELALLAGGTSTDGDDGDRTGADDSPTDSAARSGDDATEAGNDPPGRMEVAPGARLAIDLDADRWAEAGSGTAVVEADGPVVVERVVRLGDGRRAVAGVGVPASDSAVVVDGGVVAGVVAD